MRLNKILLLLPLFSLAACHSHPTPAQNVYVTIRGKHFISPDGHPLQLKGINLGNWMVPEGYMFGFKKAVYPRQIRQVVRELIGPADARNFWNAYYRQYITRQDIALLSHAGFNTLRIPIDYRLFTPENYPGIWAGPGFRLLDNVIRWASQYHMYVILDMHAAPGGQNGENIDNGYGYPWLMISRKSQERTAGIWKKIARRYRENSTVLGYDLLNEPIPTLSGYDTLNVRLQPLYRRLVRAVRSVDTTHIVILGGAQWDSNFNVFGAPFDSKVAYTFHKYWTDPTAEVIESYVAYGDRYDVPILMGESGENTNRWIARFRTVLDKYDISWCFWPYKKMEAASCVATITPPAGWSHIVRFADSRGEDYAERRKLRPAPSTSHRILYALLDSIRISHCTINSGYVKALGLHPPSN